MFLQRPTRQEWIFVGSTLALAIPCGLILAWLADRGWRLGFAIAFLFLPIGLLLRRILLPPR